MVLTYELRTGEAFPAPDKGTKVFFQEEITNSKLNGVPAGKGTFAKKPVEGKIIDGKIVFTDAIGTTNPAGEPTQVSTGDQTIRITATVGGNTDTWVIRKNQITIDPKGQAKVKVEEVAHEQPDEEEDEL